MSLILFLFLFQAIWRIPANIPPTSASTESMKGMPIMPNIRQNNRPLNVTVAKFPYPDKVSFISQFMKLFKQQYFVNFLKFRVN